MLALGVVALAVIIHTLRQVAHDVRAMRRRKALENTRD
jgi:hypothetical protein